MSQPRPSAMATPAASTPTTAAAASSAVVSVAADSAPNASHTSLRAMAAKSDTPRLLRLLTTALVLVGLVFGLAGVLSFSGLAYSLSRAEANAAQLIRVQKIQTNLLSADATATSAFLVGGLEPPAQRAAYDQAISATGALIAEASEAQPADGAALSALNQAVVDYAVTIEQARANNRQGFPVGAQYLRNASAQLRSDSLPILDNLVSANSARAADAMGSHIDLVFDILGILAVAALVVSMVWVARRFKRRINTGLAAATFVVLVAWVAGFIVLAQVDSAIASIKGGSFSSLNSAAAVRIEANNAKSNESLTLIARGSGAAFETAWAKAAGEVDPRLAGLGQDNLSTAWKAYVSTHQQIRKLDDGGSWDAAVALATGSNAKSSNALFGQFDQAATRYLDSISNQASVGLAAPRPILIVFAVLTFVAGLGAALLSRRGLAARLQEYR
jgi:hypothetical protein